MASESSAAAAGRQPGAQGGADGSSGGSSGRKRVVILGGTGRVGGSTASALLAGAAPGTDLGELELVLASRNPATYQGAVAKWPALRAAKFVACDINDPQALRQTLAGAALVVHCAGPFQRKGSCAVLEAAIAARVPYLDVCDDTAYSQQAVGYHEQAKQAGVPAITTGGIYPGTSNVMAAHMISIARKEYDDNWQYVGHEPGRGVQPTRVRYSYFTAGTGGVGPTILTTSLMLAGEDVIAYIDGERKVLPPVSNLRVVDFGPGVGRRSVYLYNLPETESTHRTLGVPSVSARFGTSPDIWNWAMWLTARLAPRSLLNDRSKTRAFSALAGPLVRLTDPLVGEAVAMRVEVDLEDGTCAAGLYCHPRCSEAVGVAIAAFARAMLAGGTQPGVWFPEQPEAVKDRRLLLQQSAVGTSRFELNRAPWALEGNPVQLGMGFYW